MPMSEDEKRAKNRERQARFRAAKREAASLSALPQIGLGSRQRGGTSADDSADDLSNVAAAREMIGDLTIPASAKWRVALVLRLAADLDSPLAIPQRAGLAARYAENLEALVAAAKPRERDELDELRRAFYRGGVGAIDDDPEGKRTTRKNA